MTLLVAVASGATAARDLQRTLAGSASRQVLWVEHRDHAVAWDGNNSWISSHDNGDVLVVLDGQLHNGFDEGDQQAEALLQRYCKLGPNFAHGLLGDFLVVVLDRVQGRLLVARDPLGVRPWYQAGDGKRGVGASDIATLYDVPWVDRSVNELEALSFLAGVSYSRGSTLYRGIRTLRPGGTWVARGGSCEEWSHHRWNIRPEIDVDWEEAVERCRQTLDQAVGSRFEADARATCELSGGLDSSAVVGTAARLGAGEILVGRLLFEDAAADERYYSDAVIRHLDLRDVSASAWIPTEEEAVEWTAALRRPAPDPHFAMIISLQRAFLRHGRRSAMTGLGGDDAFVSRSRKSRVMSALRHRQVDQLRSVIRNDLRHPYPAWRHTWRGVMGYAIPWRRRSRPPRPISRTAAEACGLADILRMPVQRIIGDRAIDERSHGLTSGFRTSVFEESALVDDATGCRSTHPFLDPRLIEGTYGLNPWFPIRDGHDRALQVAAYADRLPVEVRERRTKAEFSDVLRRAAIPYGEESLRDGPLRDSGWVDKDGLESLIEAAMSGRQGAAKPLARARALDRWLRTLS